MHTVSKPVITNLENGRNTEELKRIFVNTCNDAVDMINERLPGWNTEWNARNGDETLVPGTQKYIDYGAFIADKVKEVGGDLYEQDPTNPIGISAINIDGDTVPVGVLVSDNSKYFFFGK